MKDQKSASTVELSYLAGLWDGDGTFSIQRIKRSDDKTKRAFWVRNSFASTDPAIVNRIMEITAKMNIPRPYIANRTRQAGWKSSWDMNFNRLVGNQILLAGLFPYLSGKKITAEIVLRFVQRRLASKGSIAIVRDGKGRIVASKRADVYTAVDDADFELVRNLNKKGFYSDASLVSDLVKQEISDFDMAYLAGLWDAEGSFLITKKTAKSIRGFIFSPKCVFANCNTTTLNRVIGILNGLGIAYSIYPHLASRKDPKRADCYNIEVVLPNSSIKLLDTLIPFLSGKLEAAKLVRQFVESRILIKETCGNNRLANYTNNELLLFEQVRMLNKRGSDPRLLAEQSAINQSCELLETPNVKSRAISSQASQEEGSTTIPQGSRAKRLEAQDSSS